MATVRKYRAFLLSGFFCAALFSPFFAFAQSYGDGNFGDGSYGGSTTTVSESSPGGNSIHISLTDQASQDPQEDPEIASLTLKVAELQKIVADLLAKLGKPQTGNSTLTDSSPFLADLEVGSENDDVKRLQQFLNGQGFTVSLSGAGSIGNETTYFGTRTRDAVAAFQVFYSITPAVGYFGPLTRAKVNSLLP